MRNKIKILIDLVILGLITSSLVFALSLDIETNISLDPPSISANEDIGGITVGEADFLLTDEESNQPIDKTAKTDKKTIFCINPETWNIEKRECPNYIEESVLTTTLDDQNNSEENSDIIKKVISKVKINNSWDEFLPMCK